MQIVRVFNQGQLPGIAHGYRSLIVKEGRKVAYLLDWTTLETAKVDLRIWFKMKPVAVDYSWRYIKKAVKARLKYATKTKFIKEVLNHA